MIDYIIKRPKANNFKFAFLVHPRGLDDVFKKYAFLKVFPNSVVEFLLLKIWHPVFVAKITGLRSKKDNKIIDGCVISIPITARQMMEHREIALKKILDAVIFAKKLGVEIVGLGALTSSFSKGGLDLIDKVKINITTGHAYTAYNVTKNIFEICDILDLDKKQITVAIIGAAGSIGSTSSLLLAREGFQNLLLVDTEKKHHFFEKLKSEIKNLNNDVNIIFSHQIKDVIIADVIITVTNAPEALIKASDLKMGTIIVDDAQPSDISEDVFDRDDVLVVSAGVVHTPNIETHFNFGLADKFDNFCCLAELLILSANGWDSNYVINCATIDKVDEVAKWGREYGFQLAKFQNIKGLIPSEKFDEMKRIIHRK